MNKLPWAKYFFSMWIAALLASVVAKFLTSSLFVLVPFTIVLYWISVRSLARIKGYR
jgi:uncharacterized membrane protein